MPMRLAFWVVAVLTLTGCSVMRVDNQVESHAKWNPSAELTGKVSYIFERLPSQQSTSQPQDLQTLLEQAVANTLEGHGWRHNPEAAQWRVAVSASHTVLPRAPWESPADRYRMGLALDGGRPGRVGIGWGLWMNMEQPYHLRAVSVVVRDHARGVVAYESQARHDGRWNDSPALWQAMVQAALAGFPQPPAGVRQIDIDIPR